MSSTSPDGPVDKDARPARGGHDAAWRSLPLIVLFVAMVSAGLAADLWTKHHVFESLLDEPQLADQVASLQRRTPRDLPPGTLLAAMQLSRSFAPGVDLTLSTNPGVVFGHPMPRPVVVVATLAMVVLVVVFFLTSPRDAWPLHVALALILAGALGNLYDRLFSVVALPGAEPIRYQVRDFIDCSQIGYKWVFNVADVWLVVGVVVILLHWFWTGRTQDPRRNAAGGRATQGD